MKLNEIRQSKPGPLMDDDINAAREYETLLRKLEGTVRQNFSVTINPSILIPYINNR